MSGTSGSAAAAARELPQRHDRQDGADRGRPGGPGGAPGPGGHVRAAADPEALGPGRRRPGRHDHLAVRARHVRPGHPAPRDRVRRLAVGGRSTPRPSGSGKTPGTPSPRSWPSAPPSASCSTPHTTNAIESLNYQLRKVTKARGHFPTDDAVVKLLWLAIINIEDKRARERAARRQQTGKRSDQPARLVEGQRVMGWREALNELDSAYPGRLR